MFSPRKALFALLSSVWFLAGCGTAHVDVYQDPEATASFPKTVAVLPFTYADDVPEGFRPVEIFRKAFFNYFSYLGYWDMPLEEVDRKLADAGITDLSKVYSLNHSALKKILGTDAVIKGEILDATNFTGGFHAQTTLKGKLELVHLHTGETLWVTEHSELVYSGIITPSLMDIIEDQVENTNIRDAYSKIAERFVIKVLQEIPDPGRNWEAGVTPPQIQRIEANIQGYHALRVNDRIDVSLYGQPKMTASFDVGNWKTQIPMKETSPGVYSGFYRIRQGDRFQRAMIVGTLKDRNGLVAKKYFKGALASAGTITQAKAKNL